MANEEKQEAINSIVIEEKVDGRLRKTPLKIIGTQVSRIKGMRTDTKRNLALVSRYVLKHPDAKKVDIMREVGLSASAVNRALENMQEYCEKDDRILLITERDLEIVWKGQEEMNRRFSNQDELKKIKTADLAAAMEKSEKRYMLFRGEMTNKEGGLKQIDTIEII